MEEASFALNETSKTKFDLSQEEGVVDHMEINNTSSTTKMEEGDERNTSKQGESGGGGGGGVDENEITLSGERIHSYPSPCLSPNSTLKLGKYYICGFVIIIIVSIKK